jgi:hypothetical protein
MEKYMEEIIEGRIRAKQGKFQLLTHILLTDVRI